MYGNGGLSDAIFESDMVTAGSGILQRMMVDLSNYTCLTVYAAKHAFLDILERNVQPF